KEPRLFASANAGLSGEVTGSKEGRWSPWRSKPCGAQCLHAVDRFEGASNPELRRIRWGSAPSTRSRDGQPRTRVRLREWQRTASSMSPTTAGGRPEKGIPPQLAPRQPPRAQKELSRRRPIRARH